MPGEEGLEVVGIDTVEVNGRVQAAGTMRRGADVPNRDTVRDKRFDPVSIRESGCRTEQVAHDRPERIPGMRVILLATE
jgi:hypothetical protein